MHAEIRNKDGSLRHSNECKMNFGRKDHECPRCVEMLNGAAPRDGWQKRYFCKQKQEEEARLNAVRHHDCKKSNCAPVCTFGDW